MRKNISIIFLANLFTLMSGVVTSLLTAWALGAEGRGDLAVIVLYPNVVALLLGLGLAHANRFYLASEPDAVSPIFSNAIIFAGLMGLIALGIAELVVPSLVGERSEAVIWMLRVYLLNIPFALLYDLMAGMLEGSRQFKWAAVSRIIFFGIQSVAYLTLWLFGHLTVFTAIVTMIAAQLANTTISFAAVRLALKPKWKPSWKTWKKTINYGLKYHLGSVTSFTTLRLDQLLLGGIATNIEIGLYVVAVRLSEITTVLASSVADVLLPEIAASDKGEKSTQLLTRSARQILFIHLLILIPLVLAAPFVLEFAFGSEFAAAGNTLRILLIASMIWSVSGVVISGLNGFGYPGLSTLARMSAAIVTVPALLYWLPQYGILGAALASLVGYSVMLAVALFWLIKKRQISLGEVFRPRLEDFPLKKMLSIFKSRFVSETAAKADQVKVDLFHQLFERQAALHPNRVAIVCRGKELTYGDLNDRSNQLARHLRAKGARPETLIPICLDRSPDIAIGILGILKSGAAFVPIDPAYPDDRIGFMLADTNAPFIVTKSDLCQNSTSERILLDTHADQIANFSTENLPTTVVPDNLAYVIYTSGSTGRPKGAMLTQANLKHYVESLQKEFCLTATDRYLHLASIGFSSTRRHLLFPLAHGSSVVIADEVERLDPFLLFRLIKSNSVTIFDAVPSFQRFCLNSLHDLKTKERSDLLKNDLRLIVSASEPLLSDIPATWINEFNHPAEHFHMIGQTETSGIISLNRITGEDLAGEVKTISVGSPIANTEILLLDEKQEPVAEGEVGEIYVIGKGLGRGYLNLSELTNQKFLEIKFADGSAHRVCRTGDFARRLPDRRLECLGRQDFQVKVRGNRVELGEIEALLISHRDVKECAVIGREDQPGHVRLVAYVVPRIPSEFPVDELRSLTRLELPDYMQLSAIVVLDALPLTPNGKTDRKNLPLPDESDYAHQTDFAAPTNQIEEAVTKVFAEVLGLKQVSINSNFFNMGGHSLLATQVIVKLRKIFDVELPINGIFEAPTVAELAKRIEHCKQTNSSGAETLKKLERPLNIPLSFAQQRLWFIAQMEGDSAAYNMSEAVRLEGNLDSHLLSSALKKVVARHEILRTTFSSVAGRPFQVISDEARTDFIVTDLTSVSKDRRGGEAIKIASEFANERFDLTSGPLLRLNLIKLNTKEHILVIVFHHIISDGWSVGVFLTELDEFYHENTLPEIEIQYSDFAVWQQNWLETKDYRKQLDFWKAQLTNAPPLLELATDFPRPAVQRYQGNHISAIISPDLTKKLNLLSRQEGVTLFMTLMSAWQLLMWRYSGQEQMVIGTPIAGRTKAETENLIGFFVNTLAIKGDLSGNPTFKELLQRTKERALGAYGHQEMPFEKLVEELNPERSLSYSQIFQVMFALQNANSGKNSFGDLGLSRLKLPSQTTKFDLSLDVFEEADSLELQLEYDTDLFADETVDQMLRNFLTILESVVSDSEQTLTNVEFLTAYDLHQLLVEWNSNEVEIPPVCMHQLIEKHAEQTPEAVAVVWGNERLTYGELNTNANQLAHCLQKQGVKPDDVIGVCLERSLEMIVGILAVLKAGAAYLPLDPNYPAERLKYMTADAGVSILVTQDSLKENVADFELQSVICIDSDWSLIAQESTRNPESDVTPDNLTYITFTSGSTGKSKGALMTHRNVINIFAAWEKDYQLSEINSHLQMANFSFDVFTGDVIRALCNGKKLVLCPSELLLESEELEKLMRRESIEAAEFVPAVIRPMIEYLEESGQRLDFLKMLVVGADVWQMAEYRRLKRLCGEQTRVISSYGVTEATIDSTYFEMTDKHQKDEGIVPIGRPFANTQIYLLDPHQKLVPPGVPGELYLGGDGLARGYLNRPELTRERFIEWTVPTGEERRLYRTGDIARYRRDGVIEIIGRADHQVKLRGYRIELGEIETAISNHKDVNECVVVAREDIPGDKRLIAYLTIKGAEISSGELRRHVKESLPEYMVPSAFVVVKEWKLSPNGKIDRKQLPVPDGEITRSEAEYVAPRTPLEEKMTEIWAKLLRCDRVGITDNFFDLGGHSLMATQAVSRIRDEFGKNVPLRILFEAPTIAEFVERMISMDGSPDGRTSFFTESDCDELSLSCSQQRLWFLDQFNPGDSIYNLPVVLKTEKKLIPEILEQAVNEIVCRHEVLRTTYALSNEQPVQNIAESLRLPLEVIELDSNTEFTGLIEKKIDEPFDLFNGPLLRVSLFHGTESESYLALIFHHSICDGWSVGVFLKELGALYQAKLSDSVAVLPDLPIQYSDYSKWQQNWLQTEQYKEQLEFWRAQLENAPTVIELAFDFPRPAVQRYQGHQISAVVSSELKENLYSLSRQEGVTLFMTILSAWQLLMLKYSGQEQMVIGTPIAGRTKTETENLIGLFVNTLAIRGDLSGNPSFTELLQRTKERALGAYSHQEMPFEKLVEEQNPERSLSYAPLFQVMVALQNVSSADESLGGLEITRVKLPGRKAKFDLSLDVFEETEGLTLWIEYDTDLFKTETIEKMLAEFQSILETIVCEPQRQLSELAGAEIKARGARRSIQRSPDREFLPLQTPTEKVIGQIWQNLLNKRKIGATSDFFDLGGHSLLAFKVIMRLRAHFDLEIPMRRIFEHSTVSSLSAKIDQMNQEKEDIELELLIAELESVSEEEAQQILAAESRSFSATHLQDQ